MTDPLADVPRETIARLEHFQRLLAAENERQNLISRSPHGGVWERHILDSAQLAPLANRNGGSWADIGSGAGLPGVVVACLVQGPVTLVEPRRLRAEFLALVVAELGLSNVRIERVRAERVSGKFDTITARAVASLDRLLGMCAHLSHRGTHWVLPKGKSGKSELAEARRNWHCEATEVPSLTDPEATILVLTNVEAKRRP
jgi:16S rRNA (guanine527-N7)-methyltransferase